MVNVRGTSPPISEKTWRKAIAETIATYISSEASPKNKHAKWFSQKRHSNAQRLLQNISHATNGLSVGDTIRLRPSVKVNKINHA